MAPHGAAWSVLGVLLVACTTMSSAALNRRIQCRCQVVGFTHVQVDVGCGYLKTDTLVRDSEGRNVTCIQEKKELIPHGYELLGDAGLFKLHRASAEQAVAASRCRQEGAALAVSADPEEAGKLADLLRRHSVPVALTGITDRQHEGEFVSDLGESLNAALKARWEPRQPDNGGITLRNEDCVTLGSSALFNDVPCSVPLPFVCRLPLYPTPPAGYRFLPGLGFYKRYTKPAKYQDAKLVCKRDEGHLAVPDSFEEAEELLMLVGSDDRSTYLGIDDIEKEGHFVTATGKTMGELAFDNWEPEEPNNFLGILGGEDCVELKASGLMNDINCSISLPFFCEIPLPT